jgi:spermidine synthase
MSRTVISNGPSSAATRANYQTFNSNGIISTQAADSPCEASSILNTQERVERQLIREMVTYTQLFFAQMFANWNFRSLRDEKSETLSELRIPSHKKLLCKYHLQPHCLIGLLEKLCCHQKKEGFI